MEPTFYGVDIILLPETQRGTKIHDQGKIIEINGVRSGASFYRAGDLDFYERVIREIDSNLPHGKIFLPFDPESLLYRPESEHQRAAQESYHQESLERTRRWEQQRKEDPNLDFDAVHDFSIEKLEWSHANRNQFKMPVNALYLQAAKEAGIDIQPFTGLKVVDPLLERTTKKLAGKYAQAYERTRLETDEPIITLAEAEVPEFTYDTTTELSSNLGLLWGGFSSIDERIFGRERVFNGAINEGVLDHKMLFYFLSELHPRGTTTLDNFLPESMTYGLGMHTQTEFAQFLARAGKTIVKKPLSEAHGLGVEFLDREEAKVYMRPPLKVTGTQAARKAYQNLVTKFTLATLNMQDDLVIMQHGVESKKVVDPDTGQQVGACARAIIVNGKYMGSIWRTSGNSEGTLTEQHRHNVTNGGKVLPVNAEDDRILAEIAEASVQAYENTLRDVIAHNGVEVPEFRASFKGMGFNEEVIGFLDRLYLNRMSKGAKAHGVDLEGELRSWLAEQGARARDFGIADQLKEFGI